MFRLFIDTSVIVSSILPAEEDNKFALALLLQNRVLLLSNQYVIQELRKVLPKFIENYELNKLIDFIEAKFEILKIPTPNQCRKIKCRDRSDSPIIASAAQENCVLVSEDKHLREDASEYITALSSQEVVDVMGFGIPTRKKKW